jgi:hypothetical protein
MLNLYHKHYSKVKVLEHFYTKLLTKNKAYANIRLQINFKQKRSNKEMENLNIKSLLERRQQENAARLGALANIDLGI